MPKDPPPHAPPTAGTPIPWPPVHRELQRARGARRLVPWTMASTLLAAGFVSFAARSVRAGVPLLVVGAILTVLVLSLSVPHCPACGKSLWKRGESPGPPHAPRPTTVENDRACPGCGVRFAS